MQRAESLLARPVSDAVSGSYAWRALLRDCADSEIEYLLGQETRKTALRLIRAEAKRRGLAL